MDVSKFTLGRPIRIKTDDDIYDSYISAIALSDENFVYFKSGSLRVTLLDKLKQDNNQVGNKLDITGGTIQGSLTIEKQLYIEENEVLTFNNTEYCLIDRNGNNKYSYGNKITAYLSSDYTIQNATTYEQVPFDTAIKAGTKITLENGKIKIGKGINTVSISAKVQVPGNGVSTGGKNIVIRKNGTIINRAMYYQETVINSYYSLPPILEEVKEGDLIDLCYYGNTGDVIAGGKVFTNLTVFT